MNLRVIITRVLLWELTAQRQSWRLRLTHKIWSGSSYYYLLFVGRVGVCVCVWVCVGGGCVCVCVCGGGGGGGGGGGVAVGEDYVSDKKIKDKKSYVSDYKPQCLNQVS